MDFDDQAKIPTDLDVLLGRGGASSHHPGNIRYWTLIIQARQGYLSLGKKGMELTKKRIAENIAEQIREYGGLFLKKSGTSWYEVGSYPKNPNGATRGEEYSRTGTRVRQEGASTCVSAMSSSMPEKSPNRDRRGKGILFRSTKVFCSDQEDRPFFWVKEGLLFW